VTRSHILSCTWTRLAILIALVTLLGGCRAASPPSPAAWSAEGIGQSQAGLHPAVVNSQLGVGPNHMEFALLDAAGSLIHDARAHARFYYLGGDTSTQASPAGESDLKGLTLTDRGAPLVTFYAANVALDKTQWWGAELSVTAGGKRYDGVRLKFFVTERTPETAIGAAIPRSTQPVLRDVKDIAQIDSSTPSDPRLHQLTVAEALDLHRPIVIAFATPAFCQTRMCGPVMDQVVRPLIPSYQDRVSFVHIEPYLLDKARAGTLVPIPEMEQWSLTTEPWVFVVDADGKVAAKFEVARLRMSYARCSIACCKHAPELAMSEQAIAVSPQDPNGSGRARSRMPFIIAVVAVVLLLLVSVLGQQWRAAWAGSRRARRRRGSQSPRTSRSRASMARP